MGENPRESDNHTLGTDRTRTGVSRSKMAAACRVLVTGGSGLVGMGIKEVRQSAFLYFHSFMRACPDSYFRWLPTLLRTLNSAAPLSGCLPAREMETCGRTTIDSLCFPRHRSFIRVMQGCHTDNGPVRSVQTNPRDPSCSERRRPVQEYEISGERRCVSSA